MARYHAKIGNDLKFLKEHDISVIHGMTNFTGNGLAWQENQVNLLNHLINNKTRVETIVRGYIPPYNRTRNSNPYWEDSGWYKIIISFDAEEINIGIEDLINRLENDMYRYGDPVASHVKNSVIEKARTVLVEYNT